MDHVAAVYRLFDGQARLLYVGVSKDFGRRWKRHAWEQPWWGEVHTQSVAWYGTRKAALEAEDAAIRSEKPLHNKRGSPWELVKDDVTGFYVVPKAVKTRTVYRIREASAQEHASELARMLREGQAGSGRVLHEVLPPLVDVIRDYLAGTLDDVSAGGGPGLPDPRRVRLGEILAQRGERGASARELITALSAEGIPVARETVHRWLTAYEQDGLANRPLVPRRAISRWTWSGAATSHS